MMMIAPWTFLNNFRQIFITKIIEIVKINRKLEKTTEHQGVSDTEQQKHVVVLEVFATHSVSYNTHRLDTHIYRFIRVHWEHIPKYLGVRLLQMEQHQTLYRMSFIGASLFFLIREPESFLIWATWGVSAYVCMHWVWVKLGPKVAPSEIFIHHCIITYHNTWMLNISSNFHFRVYGTTFWPKWARIGTANA